jgi:hypothetical protein
MRTRVLGLGLVASLTAGFAAMLFSSAPAAAGTGADLKIHNETGTNVEVYIFEDDAVHKNKANGLHSGDLKNHETGVAHVKACKFSVVLFHDSDAYHAEFHDCSTTDITITAKNK